MLGGDSYSRVVSTLALFVALATGGAYAADKIGSKDIAAKAIKSKHIKDAQVRAQDVAPGAVTSTQVRDGSLLDSDFAAGELPQGPAGPQGPQGPQGAAGPAVGGVSVGTTPQATPGLCCFQAATVTVSRPARLLVTQTIRDIQLSCNAAGSCSLNLGAYLDGATDTPVPNAGLVRSQSSSTSRSYDETVYGVIDVPAGTHSVGLGFTSSGNTSVSGGGSSQTSIVAIDQPPASSPRSPEGARSTPMARG